MANTQLEATPTIQNNQVASWTLCIKDPPKADVCGDGSAQKPYPTIDLGYNSAKAASVIKVTINDTSDLNVVFAPDRPTGVGPLWIQKDVKPTAYVIAPSDQIPKVHVVTTGNGKTLTFNDNNSGDMMTLKYALNFTDGRGLAVKSIDPDIKNGGTNTPPPPPPPPPVPPTGQQSGTGAPSGFLGQVGGFDVAALLLGLVIGLIIGLILCRLRK